MPSTNTRQPDLFLTFFRIQNFPKINIVHFLSIKSFVNHLSTTSLGHPSTEAVMTCELKSSWWLEIRVRINYNVRISRLRIILHYIIILEVYYYSRNWSVQNHVPWYWCQRLIRSGNRDDFDLSYLKKKKMERATSAKKSFRFSDNSINWISTFPV